ncbi:SAM-dependent methyltransferase [hydrothermal vent metagenome]|uniref:SAM-dependent methyltransferase n=1 Tax=hydrothermal vent metagenome TaxID=652676 RepID=A0A3B0SG49_9ZZZZ
MSNEDQKEYWNDKAGEKWAANQVVLDAMLAPVTELLMEAVQTGSEERVLDIGCGTGETSKIAVDAGARVTGVDISEPMLELAKARLGDRADLSIADASEFQGEQPYDVVMSRFGVMFFDDPTAAFRNIASNLAPDGRLVFACWQEPANNGWVFVPMKAIIPLLPETPEQDPHAPGPFALADPERLRDILSEAGFNQIEIEPHSVDIVLAQNGGVEKAVEFSSQIGPAAAAMAEVDEETRLKIITALGEALAPHEINGGVALGGGIWIVKAKRAK